MAAKSYKQLYEELKEQSKPITEDELLALRAVAYGCNTNHKLQSAYGAVFFDRETNRTVRFDKALVDVYGLIERLSK